MSGHPTIHHALRRSVVVGSVLASLTVGTGTAAAHGTTWKDVDGNPSCATLGSGHRELKLEPVAQGRTAFNDGYLTGSIVVTGVRFNWSADQGVDAVIVKGGPRARIYRAPVEVKSGTSLSAPTNPANGKPYGLSHITFCYDVDAKPTPTPSPTPSPTPTPSPSPTPTPTPG